ncbi:MAG TPA: lipoprotein insertase outer membrane protein LolB [Burkholderiales bacterium]|nr:lipoprotein insertase outer membrane protein LolB [Burkholderiales bacterium]
MRYLFVFLAFLAGCSVTPPKSTAPDTVFDLSGRIAVKYGDHGFYGNLRWIHRSHSDEVWLLSPLGQTVAHIVKDSRGAELTEGDGKSYSAMDVESLTEKILGWRLPLAGLDSWIVGKAAPGSPSQASFEGQELKRLSQEGWDIRYERRFESGKPRQLILERSGILIKFVIDADT